MRAPDPQPPLAPPRPGVDLLALVVVAIYLAIGVAMLAIDIAHLDIWL